MTHRRAVSLMILCTLLWSIAGVVTRQLDAARSFEVTFWRSAFNAVALAGRAAGAARRGAVGRHSRAAAARCGSRRLCWAVMYTDFMVAITLTTVANGAGHDGGRAAGDGAVRAHLLCTTGCRGAPGCAIGVAGPASPGCSAAKSAPAARRMTGALVALAVPLAARCQLDAAAAPAPAPAADPRIEEPHMLPAVLLGALLSAAVTLPLALPLCGHRARPVAAGAAGRVSTGHPVPAGGAPGARCCRHRRSRCWACWR